MPPAVELQVHVLGSPWVGSEGAPLHLSPSVAHTLAFLALGPDEGPTRARMAAHLFADCPEPVARRRLSTALWRLRSECRDAVGHEIVDSASPDRVCLLPGVDLRVDAKEFRAKVTPVLARRAEAIDRRGAAILEAAEASYTGSLLEATFDDWVVAERDNLSNLYLAVVDHLVQFHGRERNEPQVTAYASKAVELEPLREDLHRHVMVAFSQVGRRDLAERQFQLCRLALLRELGADPMPETIALHTRLSLGAPAGHSDDIVALVADLERARSEVKELGALVERALDAVLHLR